MKPSEVLEKYRAKIREIVAAHKCRNPRVFGSTARGEDTEDSDLDLLVEAIPGCTLFDLARLNLELSTILGVPVHITTTGSEDFKKRPELLHNLISGSKPV